MFRGTYELKGLKEAYVITRRSQGKQVYLSGGGRLEQRFGKSSFRWTDDLASALTFAEEPPKDLLPYASRIEKHKVIKAFSVYEDNDETGQLENYRLDVKYVIKKYPWSYYSKEDAITGTKRDIEKSIQQHQDRINELRDSMKLADKI